ncbi:MAG: hypothetical protein GWN80_04680, partial [Gammaproteobacteria bacterium]|nr:hypothetical protein [Gammaproteobacteria bacterium]
MSVSQWEDLLADDDGGRLTSAIAGSLQKQVAGFEKFATFQWAGWTIVL